MYRWYVVNTYSGHENKVKQNLEHRAQSLNQRRAVRQVVVPTETVTEMKDNQKTSVEKRTMPGYVLVNMELNDDSWQLVKGTPGVTGFVGASNEPVPLTQPEVDRLLHRVNPLLQLLSQLVDNGLQFQARPSERAQDDREHHALDQKFYPMPPGLQGTPHICEDFHAPPGCA